ncbi:hypothetical protein N7456_011328 [Penicillium angulare]|uniref:Uncharacterized protein n=1 Tax=Penicillium angulare TaxID=116970 RepID=A0A9W9ETE8_9EURO|nr:hypothetical protein N7456_011328 [Penicillium angulare]
MALSSDESPSHRRRRSRDNGGPSDSSAREKRKLRKSKEEEIQRRYEAEKQAKENALAYKELYDRLVDYERINDEEKTRNSRLEAEVRSLRGQLNSETERADVNEWNVGKAEELILELQGTTETQRDKWKIRVEELEVNLQQERDTSIRLRKIIKKAAADVNICRNEVARSTDDKNRLQENIRELEVCLEDCKDQIVRDRERLEEFLSTTEETAVERAHSLQEDIKNRILDGLKDRIGQSSSTVRSPGLLDGLDGLNGLEFPFGNAHSHAKATKVRAERPRLTLLEESRYSRKASFSPYHRTRNSSPNSFRPLSESAPSESFEKPLFSPFSERDEPFHQHPRYQSESPSPEHFWGSTQPFNPNQRSLDLELELASEDLSDLEDISFFHSGSLPASSPTYLQDQFSFSDTEFENMSSQPSSPFQGYQTPPSWTGQESVLGYSRKRRRFRSPEKTDEDYPTQPPLLAQLKAGNANIDLVASIEPEELPPSPKRAKAASPEPMPRRIVKLRKLDDFAKHRVAMARELEWHRQRQRGKTPSPEPSPEPIREPSPEPLGKDGKPFVHHRLKCPKWCPKIAPYRPPPKEPHPYLSLSPAHYLRQKYELENGLAKPRKPLPAPATEDSLTLTPFSSSSGLSVSPSPGRSPKTKQNAKQNKANRISKRSPYRSSNPKMPGSWPRERGQDRDREATVSISAIERLGKAAERTKQWYERTKEWVECRKKSKDTVGELLLAGYVFGSIFGPIIQQRLEQTFSPRNLFPNALSPEAMNAYRELYDKDELTWWGIWFFDFLKAVGLDRAPAG